MIRPGPRNLITDVPGLHVGQAEDGPGRTGVTVLLPARPCVAAVDVRGSAPGTRETDALAPGCLVEKVDAVFLSGGSAFGLDSGCGVMAALAAMGRGFPVGPAQIPQARVPIVPGAILMDLLNGGDKPWLADPAAIPPPYRALAIRACAAAGEDFALGNAGAGLGAKAGALKGGIGSASTRLLPGSPLPGFTVGALVAANPLGSAIIPGTTTLWAWPLEMDGEMGGQAPPRPEPGSVAAADLFPRRFAHPDAARPGANTSIAIVATDADLTRAECLRLALMAQDGLARAIRPSHTPFDGDTVFALATGERPLPEPRASHLFTLGVIAADTLARAVGRAVFHAETLGDRPGYRDWRREFSRQA